MIYSRITESSQAFESLHALSCYKQITSHTISGPVCQDLSSVVRWILCHSVTARAASTSALVQDLLSSRLCEQHAVFTWAKFILPGQKYENDLLLVAVCCLTPRSRSERRDTSGGRMGNITLRSMYRGLDQIIHLFFIQGFFFFVLSS